MILFRSYITDICINNTHPTHLHLTLTHSPIPTSYSNQYYLTSNSPHRSPTSTKYPTTIPLQTPISTPHHTSPSPHPTMPLPSSPTTPQSAYRPGMPLTSLPHKASQLALTVVSRPTSFRHLNTYIREQCIHDSYLMLFLLYIK